MFDEAHAFIAKWEGGWVNDALDPGGETKFGISKRAYPDLDIASLTPEQAKAIYERDYWREAGCDKLPDPLALIHFDCAVNQGVARAVKFLQQAVRTRADGVLGPETLGKVEASWMHHPEGVLREYCARRAAHYGSLATFKRFGLGWMRRLFDAHETALSILRPKA